MEKETWTIMKEKQGFQIVIIVIQLRNLTILIIILKTKYVAYNSQGSHTGKLDFSNRLTDTSYDGIKVLLLLLLK